MRKPVSSGLLDKYLNFGKLILILKLIRQLKGENEARHEERQTRQTETKLSWIDL